MNKYGFKINTRGGMTVENLMVQARDRAEAENKIGQQRRGPARCGSPAHVRIHPC
ncbi:MAG: hypothetical protein K2Y16_15025 [Burkholderiales bacterium]|nr:hypothetical protein [Burkholderiales bacterium]